MAEYRLTPAAERDLENIWLYTRRQWSTEQADRYTAILANAFAELAQAPKIAPSCDHIRSGYRRRSVDRHMIYCDKSGCTRRGQAVAASKTRLRVLVQATVRLILQEPLRGRTNACVAGE